MSAGAAAQAPPSGMTSKQKWTLGITALGAFMISLDALVVSTALSTIRVHLHASISTLEWAMNSYNLAFAVLLLTGAALGDRFGRRRMFITGLAIFGASSALCALAPAIGWLIAWRAVQGAGAAMMMPLAVTLLSAVFPPQSRGKALGIFSGLTGLGTFSGPFVGGAVSQGLAWQWIFWINVPIGLICIALVLAHIDESAGPNKVLDIIGLILVTVGAFGLVWGVVQGDSVGWGSGEVVGSLAGGFVMVIVFVLWEIRTPAPMLPMRFWRSVPFSTANLANFCLWASVYGTLFLLAQFLQVSQHNGPFGAGLRLMPWTGTLMVCAPIAGNLADKLGERWFMVVGLALNAVGMTWLALIAKPDLAYGYEVIPLVIGGCGVSMGMPAALKSVIGAVKPPEIGQASGVLNTMRIFGGVWGIAVLTAVFTSKGSFASPQSFADGFKPGIGVAAGLALVGSLAGLGMSGRRKAPMQAPPVPAAASVPAAGGGS